jgi:oxygen-independent coproporphyrinogen-3 oxidase
MFGVYLHIPFCLKKCYYCDFISYEGEETHFLSYCEKVKAEVEIKAREYRREVTSIYFGGGTPTLLKPALLTDLLDKIQSNFNLTPNIEITIEANPETVTQSGLEKLLEKGFNRLSLGFQSLDDRLLALLGRRHTARKAVKSYIAARKAGFRNINIDLIFGIPFQTVKDWQDTLTQVIDLVPDHISCYALTVEPSTLLGKQVREGRLRLPEEEEQVEMYLLAIELLAEAGYRHYEISNFAQPGKECHHNLLYWHFSDYLGLGLGAHSKIGNERFVNTSSLADYLAAVRGEDQVSERHWLTEKEMMSEYLFMGLRLTEGIDRNKFSEKFGCDLFDLYGSEIKNLIELGLLTGKGKLRLTQKGLLLANEVFEAFV